MRLALCATTAIVVSNRPRPKASGRSLADERPAGAHPERDVARQGMPDRVEHDAVVEGAGHEAPFPAARPDRREDDRPALAVVGQRDRAGGRERPGALRPLDRLAPPRLVEDVDAVEAAPRRREARVGDDDVAVAMSGGVHRAVRRALADRAAESAFERRALGLGQVAQVDERAGLREPQRRLHERLELVRLDVVARRGQITHGYRPTPLVRTPGAPTSGRPRSRRRG